MVFVNNRLIVNEKAVNETVDMLQEKVQQILDSHVLLKGKGLIALVEYDDEMYCEDRNGNGHVWMQYTIRIINPLDTLIILEFSTDGLNPTLVYQNEKFVFFYVFECGCTTGTHPEEMVNIGCTESKYDFTIEQIIEKELNKREIQSPALNC